MASTEDIASRRQPEQPAKQPPVPKGSTVHKLPLPKPALAPGSATYRQQIYVNAKTPFRSITTRVRKQLNKILRTSSAQTPNSFTARLAGRKSLPLELRVQAIRRHVDQDGGSGIGLEDSNEVIVMGTGRAIEKVLQVAHFFQGQRDCVVQLRTASVRAVDHVVEEGEEGGRGEKRERMVSSLEVHIRLR